MGQRRKARELALQTLYQAEFQPEEARNSRDFFWESRPLNPEVLQFASRLVQGTLDEMGEIDRLIQASVKNWDMERLSAIDRNIIRIGTYEMVFLSKFGFAENPIPPAVTINEAVEIAKKYGTPDSGKFVNGILDQIRKANVRTDEGSS